MHPSTADAIRAAPSGAVWRRVDLHLHSPAIPGFGCPPGVDLRTEAGRARVADSYVEQLRAAGIDIGAITDYNAVHEEWYGLLHQRAEAAGITLLPGVELSFNAGGKGLHVLAILPLRTDLPSVSKLLAALDRDPCNPLIGTGSRHRDIDPKEHVIDALREVRDRLGCLLIAAHPDQKNGLARSFPAADAAEILRQVEFDAVEHCPQDVIDRLLSTGKISRNLTERLARVEFSDPKSITEIGTKQTQRDGLPRATYVKLSTAEVGALRLALHDPQVRVHVGDAPAPPAQPRIVGMAVEGTGFLGDLMVRWNPELNTLIGGRGAGKSAILETMRYALDLEPYERVAYHESLVRHALGSGGKATLVVERPTATGKAQAYEVSRILGERARVRELTTGSWTEVAPRDVFGPAGQPLIFGQREIQSLADREDSRLQLVDDLVGEEARQAARRVGRTESDLRANAAAILEVLRRLDERDDAEQQLERLRHEIAVYEREGVAEKLQVHTDLSADAATLHRARTGLDEQADAWRAQGRAVVDALAASAAYLDRGRSAEASLLRDAAAALTEARQRLSVVNDEGAEALGGVRSRLDTLLERWAELIAPYDRELVRLRRELNSDTLDPDRLLHLTAQRNGLEPLVAEYRALDERLADLRRQRSGLLAELRQRRHEEFTLRRDRCAAVERRLGGRLRLAVAFKGHKAGYRQALASLFRGSGLTGAALDLLVKPEATDGTVLVEVSGAGPEQLETTFGLTAAMAQKAVDWLAAEESRRLELELETPADDVRMALVVDEEPRELSRLSLGQRATAVLLLLFALESRPLVLDQPEDDLDNRFVYEDVVTLLREAKGTAGGGRPRQLIVATHNANIPVLGDAELILALEGRDDHAEVVGRASIDDEGTRERVRTVLEGGEEAFRRRVEKYGGA